MNKKLYRSTTDKMLSGVCAGFADYFAVDSTLIRIGTVILFFATGVFPILIAYIACAAIMPERPIDAAIEDVEVLDKDGNKVHTATATAPSEKKNNKVIGIILVGLGGFMLFNRMFTWFDHRTYWALALVAVGAFILYSGRSKNIEEN